MDLVEEFLELGRKVLDSTCQHFSGHGMVGVHIEQTIGVSGNKSIRLTHQYDIEISVFGAPHFQTHQWVY